MYINNARSLNLNYSWLDFFNKKQLFLIGLLYTKQPQNYISFSNPGLTDNFIYNAVTDKYMELYTAFMRLEKFYHNYTIKIAPQLSFSQIQSYIGIGAGLYQAKNTSTRVGLATSIKFNKALIVDCNFFQTFKRSSSDNIPLMYLLPTFLPWTWVFHGKINLYFLLLENLAEIILLLLISLPDFLIWMNWLLC